MSDREATQFSPLRRHSFIMLIVIVVDIQATNKYIVTNDECEGLS